MVGADLRHYFDVTRFQFDGCAIAFYAATVDRLAPTFEKVRETISKACGYTCDDGEQPCTISLNEIWLVLHALDGTRDHRFFLCARDFFCRVSHLEDHAHLCFTVGGCNG